MYTSPSLEHTKLAKLGGCHSGRLAHEGCQSGNLDIRTTVTTTLKQGLIMFEPSNGNICFTKTPSFERKF